MYIKGEENMKNKTMLRFLLCFLMISILGVICSQPISLAATSENTPAKNFFNVGEDLSKEFDFSAMVNIQAVVMGVGVVAAVVVVAIYAIQWMMATPAKRQELKAGMWPLIIGVFLLICGSALTTKIYDMFSNDGGSLADIIKNTGTTVSSIVVKVGYVVGTVMILVVGIQWLISTPNKRQELKGRMLNIIIGAALLIAGVTILGMVEKTANDVKKGIVVGDIYDSEKVYSDGNIYIAYGNIYITDV